MTDESDPGMSVDEPPIEEFEAEEAPPAGPWAVPFRVLRAVVALLVIVALLFYFVAPFRTVVRSIPRYLKWPSTKMRVIPLAPRPQNHPRLPT